MAFDREAFEKAINLHFECKALSLFKTLLEKEGYVTDIPRLPQGTTAYQRGKELFDKGLAKGEI
jgi:hypothetical protein